MKNASHTASAATIRGLAVFPALSAAIALIFAAIFVFSTPTAVAQVSGPDQPLEGVVPGNTTDGASADAELWRQIRQGAQGTVAGQDPRSTQLIQSDGYYWQETRNGPLALYTAWGILGIIFLVSIFFAIRGRIRVEHGLSGHTIKRFSLVERVSHWLLASSFIVLALTGLNLLFGRDLIIPLIGKEAFAAITIYGKFIHNYVAFAFMASLVMITVLWIGRNLPNWHDIVWILRGGGLFGGGHPKARKFNAGQKILFWLVILCGISISLSGWALLYPFQTSMFGETFALLNSWFGWNLNANLSAVQEQQYQALWHTIMAAFMIVVVIGHIYIGTVGMEGALSAMTTGEVDANWAREHHSLWVEEVEAEAKAEAEEARRSATDDGKLQPAE
ncbi:MAG: formate dehydrogenase subunit gamma [Rhodomicrobiaceae bacterium]